MAASAPDRGHGGAGAFLAKAFVAPMPVHIHIAILDAAVIMGGMVMIAAALRQLV